MDETEILLERNVLQQEYKWLLEQETPLVIQEVHNILMEACKNFPLNIEHAVIRSIITPEFMRIIEQENQMKPEKFLLTSPLVMQQVKCMITLDRNLICEADLALKLQKQQVVPHQTRIYSENPWRLQQIQDAGNHLMNALAVTAECKEDNTRFSSGRKVLNILDSIIDSIKQGRECLTLPRKRTLEEIVKNPSLKLFKPALPNDAVVSFYVQAQKLVLAVYHLCTNQLNKIDIAARYQLECSVPWLNDSLVLFTAALHSCQQLKDKIGVVMECCEEECVSNDQSMNTKKCEHDSMANTLNSPPEISWL